MANIATRPKSFARFAKRRDFENSGSGSAGQLRWPLINVNACHGLAILCEFAAIRAGGQEGQSRQDADIKLLQFSADVGRVSEKRSEPRVNMMARIEALWQDEAGASQISRGKLEDLSDGGLSIRINEPIGIGSKLIVRTPRENFTGTVVQCRQYGRDFVLGILRDAGQKPDGK